MEFRKTVAAAAPQPGLGWVVFETIDLPVLRPAQAPGAAQVNHAAAALDCFRCQPVRDLGRRGQENHIHAAG